MLRYLLSSLILLLAPHLPAAGIEFFAGTWEEALERAEAEEKLIFLDAYASWCGPCKTMAATTFQDDEVGAFFNGNFINLKLDMEKAESASFRQLYSVRAYPTLFFLNAEGESVKRITGAQDVEQLIAAAKSALASAEPVEELAAAYAEGDRDPKLMYRYVRALVRGGESYSRVVNDYLREHPKPAYPEEYRMLLLAAGEVDSRAFETMLQFRLQVINVAGEEAFVNQVRSAATATAHKAATYGSQELLAAAIAAVEAEIPAEAERFALESELSYHLVQRDGESLAKVAKKMARKMADTEAAALASAAGAIAEEMTSDESAMEAAELLARAALAAEALPAHYFQLAEVLYKRNNKGEALDVANQGLEIAKDSDPRVAYRLQRLIQLITNG